MPGPEITRSLSRNAPVSPFKGRMAADAIRGMPAQRALETLEFSRQKAAGILWKTLRAAVSNAEENHAADADDLVVSRVEVNAGVILKRARFGARGRVSRIKRRRSHILVALSSASAQPEPAAQPAAQPEPAARPSRSADASGDSNDSNNSDKGGGA